MTSLSQFKETVFLPFEDNLRRRIDALFIHPDDSEVIRSFSFEVFDDAHGADVLGPEVLGYLLGAIVFTNPAVPPGYAKVFEVLPALETLSEALAQAPSICWDPARALPEK